MFQSSSCCVEDITLLLELQWHLIREMPCLFKGRETRKILVSSGQVFFAGSLFFVWVVSFLSWSPLCTLLVMSLLFSLGHLGPFLFSTFISVFAFREWTSWQYPESHLLSLASCDTKSLILEIQRKWQEVTSSSHRVIPFTFVFPFIRVVYSCSEGAVSKECA
jgi:hypothetical protein